MPTLPFDKRRLVASFGLLSLQQSARDRHFWSGPSGRCYFCFWTDKLTCVLDGILIQPFTKDKEGTEHVAGRKSLLSPAVHSLAWIYPSQRWDVDVEGEEVRAILVKGLLCYGFTEKGVLPELDALTHHERMEILLSARLPQEYWPTFVQGEAF